MKNTKSKSSYNAKSNQFHYIKSCNPCDNKYGCKTCHNECKPHHDPCDNKCDCNPCHNECKPHHDPCKSESFGADCCVESLRDALMAIMRAVNSMGSTTFSVNVVIYTSSGNSFTIPFSSSNLSNIQITKDSIIYNGQVISLNSIIKIEVLSNSVSSSFSSYLINALNDIASSCSNPYLAIDIDDDYICPKCHKNRCNCKCNNSLQNFLNNNGNQISEISLPGLGENSSVVAVNDFSTVSVIQSIGVSIVPTSVLQQASIVTTTTNAISALTTSSVNLVSNLNLGNANVINSINQFTTPVVTSLAVTPRTVLTGFNQTNTNVVSNITSTTSNANFVSSVSPV